MDLIRLSVGYYDHAQETLFQSFPNAAKLNGLVANGIDIPKDEFLSHMMFTEQMDVDGFRTYAELTARIPSRLGDIDDMLSFDKGSLQAKISSSQMMQLGFNERIGVALGLSVMNNIHGLTNADWKKIPEAAGQGGHSTFDFVIASVGTNFIQAENKGSVAVDNSQQSGSVRIHYKNIKKKKAYVRAEEKKKGIPIHQNLYYGTIGVLDERRNSTAKVWLVDPPAFELEMEPNKYKLLARLHFYLDEFRNIGVKENITKALEGRITQIAEAKDYLKYDNEPLRGFFTDSRTFFLYMDGKMFASVNTNEAFGRIFIIDFRERTSAYLIAYPKALIRLIISQDFEAILKYNFRPDFVGERVNILMRVSRREMEEHKLIDKLKFMLSESRRYYFAEYFGKINHSIDGRIFGLLDHGN